MTREHWTPATVREAMFAAAEWLKRTGGPDGPPAIRSSMPAYKPELDDFLAEGWGLPEEPDAPSNSAPMLTPEQVGQYEDALTWPGRLLAPYDPDLARAVQADIAAAALRRPLKIIARERGFRPGQCERWRDRGLSFLSVALDRAGVKPW